MLPGVKWCDSALETSDGADVLVVLTEWNEFRALDLPRLAKAMATPRMADLRNIYSAKETAKAGFKEYAGVGR